MEISIEMVYYVFEVNIMKFIKIIAALLCAVLLFSACAKQAEPAVKLETENWNTNYKYVFVHGLSGWGSYDDQYKSMPYWGMLGGDLMEYLNERGFECYAASVAPQGSAWDRACELYAQLTGNVVDYGKEHSERCDHERFGTDYSENPLIDNWNAENKINLLGHSFGGATVRLLSELMANGSEAERAATDESEISGLFTGGKADWIYSITALAAPHNGTTAYNVGSLEDDELEEKSGGIKEKIHNFLSGLVSAATATEEDGRILSDYAAHDMYIDNALEMNGKIVTLQNAYYFSFPCSSSLQAEDGTYYPDESITESLFIKSATSMGKYTGVTEKGFVIDESWRENDGLVNVVSAKAPIGAPQKGYEAGNVQMGEWNIMPTYRGDHMSLQGGLFKRNDVKEFYLEHLNLINSL